MNYFDNVKRFSFFIAPRRSGHSIVAHLLSAHPHILFCDELDALMWFDEGFSAEQVYALIKYQNQRLGRPGRKKSGYSYKIADSWQYRWDKYPKVVGDSKGDKSTFRMADDPSFVSRLRDRLGVPIRAFVQARHPYAIASSEMRNRKWSKSLTVDKVIAEIEGMETAAAQLEDAEKMTVYHEDVLNDPRLWFEKMFSYLEVEPMEEILAQVAQKVWREPATSRKKAPAEPKKDADTLRLDEAMRKSSVFSRYLDDPDLYMPKIVDPSKDIMGKVKRKIRRMQK